MNKILLVLLFIAFSNLATSQTMQINNVTVATNDNAIDVTIQTTSLNGAGFLSNSYTVTGNVIDIELCYWFNVLAPVLTFTDVISIPLETPGTYTLNVSLVLSSSMEVCNNFANADTFFLQYNHLSSENYARNQLNIYPNPSSGIIHFNGLDANINRVEVFDILGKNIKNEVSFSQTLDLSDLPNGMYLVVFDTDKGMINKKIVIQK
ncbi:T9SS type A sorting domain-containing protein [Flavobacterium sp.]|jgi:hypothetical protein|uniref:T9SS type A sorting domain-containing protein n=1 Tax=Flavobacterium sp. TaxID=239 RepID=UPI0037BEDD3C